MLGHCKNQQIRSILFHLSPPGWLIRSILPLGWGDWRINRPEPGPAKPWLRSGFGRQIETSKTPRPPVHIIHSLHVDPPRCPGQTTHSHRSRVWMGPSCTSRADGGQLHCAGRWLTGRQHRRRLEPTDARVARVARVAPADERSARNRCGVESERLIQQARNSSGAKVCSLRAINFGGMEVKTPKKTPKRRSENGLAPCLVCEPPLQLEKVN